MKLALFLILSLFAASLSIAADSRNSVPLSPEDSMQTIIEKAARVVPSPRQLAWQKIEFEAFVHFGMNAFTNKEWGDGTEDPKIFNPTDFDANQWVQACQSAGMKALILTAKHHDGFCLWPSAFTDHSVKNSSWRGGKGDMVKEVSEACRKGGLKFGIYVSPWDRHEPTYGTPAYNDHFKKQLRELMTNYGPISEVWFDGANGEGPNGKRQEYDWQGYFDIIRELQPNAAISVVGPDVRWCGNEAGHTRESEWSVVPEGSPADSADLGSLDALKKAAERGARLIWFPAQVNTSIRPGWFYHPEEDGKVKPLSELLDVYYGSVGGNAQFLLNLPPDRRGRIADPDVRRLEELGNVLKATFAHDLALKAKTVSEPSAAPGHGAEKAVDGNPDSYWTPGDGVSEATLEFDLGSEKTFNRAMLQEEITVGQRIEAFELDAWDGSDWKTVARSTTVGYKRLLRFDDVTARKARVRITRSRLNPTLSTFGLYLAPAYLSAPPAAAWKNVAPDGEIQPAKRESDRFPLSDQKNAGGWKPYPAFSDEFDGDRLDSKKWLPTNPGWKGRQPAFFSPENVAVKDGSLQLTMNKKEPSKELREEGYHDYASAAVQSAKTTLYGYYEVRAQAMKSAGSSSFWFYDIQKDWWTEIDVFEIGGRAPGFENKMNINLHVMHTPTSQEHWSVGGVWRAATGLAEDYHVYGLEWDEKAIKFYFDGVLVREGPNTHWHQPLTLNFDSETMPEWFGIPIDADLPSVYHIDYVRAWKKEGE